MPRGEKRRVTNRQLDEVCLDCLEKIGRQDCNKCPVLKLKKINNNILNERFKKEFPERTEMRIGDKIYEP